MRNDLEWRRCRNISISMVEDVELEFRISFPEDFKRFIISHSGGCPLPHTYDFGEHYEAVLHNFLNFNKDERYNVLKTYKLIADRLLDKVYPFAEDPFGNLICYDFRENHENPKIVFWDHEEDNKDNFKFICNSIDELLAKLYEA